MNLKSKLLWLNIVALVAHIAKQYYEVDALPVLDPLWVILANLGLRLVVKEPETVTPVTIV
jgi:hypothetical protein